MKNKLFIIILSLIILICPTFLLTACKHNESYTPVVIMAGQSNMAGCTQIKYVSSQYIGEDRANNISTTNEYVLISDKNNNNNKFDGVNLNFGSDQYSFGPEVGIAETLSKKFNNKTNKKIYLIKYAIGGTDLYQDWQSPTMTNTEQGGYLFSQLTEYVDTMFNQLNDEGLNPKLVAILWMQGENDAMTEIKAKDYGNNLKMFVNDLRIKYNKYATTKKLNFIDAYINSHFEYHDIVNSEKKKFAKLSKYNYCLNTLAPNLVIDGVNGLTTTLEDSYAIGPIDPNHYDSLSMLKLGNMMGEQLLKLIK